MPPIKDLLLSILLPAVLCGLALATAWGARAREVSATRAAFAGACAFAAGYVCAHVALLGELALPSAERTLAARDWIPLVVLAVVPFALVQAFAAQFPRWAAPVRALFAAAIVGLSLRALRGEEGFWLALACTFVLLALADASTERMARAARGASVPIALWIVVTCASAATLIASTGVIAQLLGGLAACLGAAVVIAWWNPRFSLAGGAVQITLIVLAAALINAVWFSELSKLAALLIAVAIFTPRLADLAAGLTPLKRLVLRAACAAVPAALAVFVAWRSAPAEDYY